MGALDDDASLSGLAGELAVVFMAASLVIYLKAPVYLLYLKCWSMPASRAPWFPPALWRAGAGVAIALVVYVCSFR